MGGCIECFLPECVFCLSFQFLLKANKFDVVTRDSKLTLSLDTDSKASVSINLKEANPSQLRLFLDSLNGIKAYHSSLKGKIHLQSLCKDNVNNCVHFELS